jgi:hypothetical protein
MAFVKIVMDWIESCPSKSTLRRREFLAYKLLEQASCIQFMIVIATDIIQLMSVTGTWSTRRFLCLF